MGYLSTSHLQKLGFKKLGKNVLVSDKASIYNFESIEIGDNSRIDDFCVISGSVKIGENVHFAVFCNVAGGVEGITFHDFAGLAYGVHVFSQSDDYSGSTMTNPTVPPEFKNETKAPIVIGRHCIVGTHSIICPGVIMAEGSAVGAKSMVTKSTEPWSIYFGVPAKKIKNRKQDILSLELDFKKRALLKSQVRTEN